MSQAAHPLQLETTQAILVLFLCRELELLIRPYPLVDLCVIKAMLNIG